jgi:hypothetical protein
MAWCWLDAHSEHRAAHAKRCTFQTVIHNRRTFQNRLFVGVILKLQEASNAQFGSMFSAGISR